MSDTIEQKLELEDHICGLANMAQLASKVADDLNTIETRANGDKGVWIGMEDVELLIFAVYDLEKRAKALRTLYCGC